MARSKKKTRTESKVSLSRNDSHPLQTVYMLLAMMGAIKEKSDLHLRYAAGTSSVSIAIPSIKYAIALDGDNPQGFKDDGWHVEHVAYSDIEPFARVFHAVDSSRIASIYVRVDPNTKSTSKPEEKLFTEFQRRLLPVPDRNYKFTRDDGSELTTPDFTWVDEKIVFFMDGAYWHSVKSDKEIIAAIKSDKKIADDIVAKRKDKVRNDGSIRSELASRGWLVLSCTDEDIEDDTGVHRVVDQVEKALNQSKVAKNLSYGTSSDDEDDYDKFLS